MALESGSGSWRRLPGPFRSDTDTPGEALSGIRRLVADCVADMRTNGEPVPEPMADRAYSGKFMVRVPPETLR